MTVKRGAAILFAIGTVITAWAADPNSEKMLLGAVHSEVQPPTLPIVREILESVCPGHISVAPRIGCSNWDEASADAQIRPRHVNGILLGHFLSASSDDAVLSADRGENHPERFGGTEFLTRDAGAWKPLWYHSGIITRNCMVVKLKSRGSLTVCESSYVEGGHQTHDLYSLQFLAIGPEAHLLLSTDTFVWRDILQKETLDRVRLLSKEGRTVLRAYLHYTNVRNPERLDYRALDSLPTKPYQIDFLLEDGRFVLSPSSAATFAELFKKRE